MNQFHQSSLSISSQIWLGTTVGCGSYIDYRREQIKAFNEELS